MFGRVMYSDDGSMVVNILIGIAVLVVLYYLWKRLRPESAIGNPYAGTSYGFYPYTIFNGAVPIPAVNY